MKSYYDEKIWLERGESGLSRPVDLVKRGGWMAL